MPETRLERVRQMQKVVNKETAESLALLERMTLAKISGGNTNLNGAYIRSAVIAAVAAYGQTGKPLPRGYQVNGTGDRTPYYISVAGNHDSRLTDAEILAEARTGWLFELCEGFEKALSPQAKTFLAAAENGFEGASIADPETKVLVRELMWEAKEFAKWLAEEGRVGGNTATLIARAEKWEADHA